MLQKKRRIKKHGEFYFENLHKETFCVPITNLLCFTRIYILRKYKVNRMSLKIRLPTVSLMKNRDFKFSPYINQNPF